ncbi:phosphoenolpyruvate synthase [Nonomuraea endophytica]|uniref:Pyruvate,water dikinase n=1 Tax=Nonomuraea endophytica TaxID=714136 RepID=A0A7W8A1F1_9ACTN|nr:phosphoenolpyruvate synthase [Nonomuraea endophytica]MBB5077760.1 pyruvate,water dikinase [Nonomuraea endophytica]
MPYPFIATFEEPDRERVGGKGAALGELTRAGLPVPGGFCLTTDAFAAFVGDGMDGLHDELDGLDHADLTALADVGARVRGHLMGLPMPPDVETQLLAAWDEAGAGRAYAVRSSATAEDLAGASFAGQQDTFLNVVGRDQLLDAVHRCWASLYTDRAIAYRARGGFGHRGVRLAVVVQHMVEPEVSGVMFTADPVSGDRRDIVVNASWGLGESIVSGLVDADLYRVRHGVVTGRVLGGKKLSIEPLPGGGTRTVESTDRGQALPDAEIRALAELGGRVQRHFGTPQDVEWTWARGRFHIVQSRPITSLFPVPEGRGPRVYFSFGHQQMMTDAIKPLGRSVLRTFFPFGGSAIGQESPYLVPAGGRLYIDVTRVLATRLGRPLLLRALAGMDEQAAAALARVAQRPEYRRAGLRAELEVAGFAAWTFARIARSLLRPGAARVEAEAFIAHTLRVAGAEIGASTGAERVRRIQRTMRHVPIRMYAEVLLKPVAGMLAGAVAAALSRRWLGDDAELPALTKSLPGNVTTEMGLAVGDLADLARDRPAVLAFLRDPPRPLVWPEGEFTRAFENFLRGYGMRAPGEIDLTRTRWREEPEQLFAGILANVETTGPGEHRRRFRDGEREVAQAARRLRGRLLATRGGWAKAVVMARVVRVYRELLALREHDKYFTVRLFDVFGTAVREEAAELVANGVLETLDDVDYLTLGELLDLLAGGRPAVPVKERRAAHAADELLRPPRVLTGDGEAVAVARAAEREGALAGQGVSAGSAEGRARVVLRPQDARLEPGDILVAPYTDPGWTPLFAAVTGLVLEVGGMMTHGAVVARELGLPAVVGVDGATTAIPDGARIRVDGTLGTVHLL